MFCVLCVVTITYKSISDGMDQPPPLILTSSGMSVQPVAFQSCAGAQHSLLDPRDLYEFLAASNYLVSTFVYINRYYCK